MEKQMTPTEAAALDTYEDTVARIEKTYFDAVAPLAKARREGIDEAWIALQRARKEAPDVPDAGQIKCIPSRKGHLHEAQ